MVALAKVGDKVPLEIESADKFASVERGAELDTIKVSESALAPLPQVQVYESPVLKPILASVVD